MAGPKEGIAWLQRSWAENLTEDLWFKWLATDTEQRHTHSLHSKCIKWISSSCISNIFREMEIVCVIVLIYLHLF